MGQRLVVGIVGALVIGLATAGLLEIHGRAGPYEVAAEPVAIHATSAGDFTTSPAQGSQGPGGLCVPPDVGGSCRPAHTSLRLRVAGLPRVPEATYTLYLLGVDLQPVRLGVLEREGQEHVLAHDAAQEAPAWDLLLLTLERSAQAATPSDLRIAQWPLPATPGPRHASLNATLSATPASGTGNARAAEIGGFSKSVAVSGEVRGAPTFPGWHYHAWLEDAGGTRRSLGALSGGEARSFDGRIEGLRLEDQVGVVVTIEPGSGAEEAERPVGLDAFRFVWPSSHP